MDAENESTLVSRRMLRWMGILLACVFAYYVALPYGMNALSASSSAKSQTFLRPVQWSRESLDPAAVSFSTVVLYGEYDSTAGEFERARSGKFELVMLGPDCYFRREWRQRFGGWRWRVEMAVTNFYSDISISWRGYGSGGGGTDGYDGVNRLLVGRRLWAGASFAGASTNSLHATSGGSFRRTEEFSDLVRHGPFLIPRRIIFTNWDHRVFTYRVKGVLFRNDPDSSWFLEKRKRFHYSEGEEKKALSGSRDKSDTALSNAIPVQAR